MSVAIAGAGPVARALGKALRAAGIEIACVASRNPDHAQAAAAFIGGSAKAVRYVDIPSYATHVIIAVSDCAITHVAEEIAASSGKIEVALHTCGSYGPGPLHPLAAVGVSCAALHPLQTIREAARADLRSATYAISGDGAALHWAEQIARALSGRVIRIDADARPVYHAAAVVASNYVVSVLHAAEQLMIEAGVPQPEALRALEPLVRSTVDNVFDLGAVQALTGPVVRGDAATITTHTEAIQDATVAGLYRAAGLQALRIARQRGLTGEQAQKVSEALARE